LFDLPEPKEYAGLVCVEAPDVRFEDIIRTHVGRDGVADVEIDPTFIEVCEPGSIQVISTQAEAPVVFGAYVAAGRVMLRSDKPIETGHTAVVIKISGIRKGRSGVRFPRFTRDEFNRNTRFWGNWNN